MNTDTGTDTSSEEENLVDGGTPTPEEARLAQELADEEAGKGKDTAAGDGQDVGTSTGGEGSGDDAGAGGEGSGAAGGGNGNGDGAAAGDDAGVADAAAGDAGTPGTPPETTPSPTPPPAAAEPPQPPMDFDAEFAKNQEAFDSGEKSAEEFQQRVREISKAESGFIARLEIFNERQQTAKQTAQAEFATAAAAWEAENKEFMANPLYAQVMQNAINAVDAKQPGLAPADLMAQAAKVAFEFTHYTPPTAATNADAAKEAEAAKRAKIAEAKAGRKPAAVPATLSATPTGAHVDTPTGSAFSNLDALDIDSLENQVSRMSPEQLEAYLQDAPGAKATGQ